MRRRILGVSTLLVVLVACRDGPAELTAPVEARMAPQPDVTVSADAVKAAPVSTGAASSVGPSRHATNTTSSAVTARICRGMGTSFVRD